MRFRGGRWDGGDGRFNNGRWKGGGRDVLKGNVVLRISSKDLLDERVLGGCGKEVFLFVFAIGGLMGRDVGKDVKTIVWGGGDDGGGFRSVERHLVLN